MGGCRCSYRSCKVRSDRKTHMFHFPVFDKMRCHQWITNALKPNFLNLKLSQLRNRVICQHHFKDDNFMNFKRDKLKNSAVPTEDGPYCISDQIQIMITEEDDKPSIPINADDIENEILNSLEKKAHSSVKYGDFLISDVTELFNTSHNTIDIQASQKKVPRHIDGNSTKLLNKTIDSRFKSQTHEEHHKYTINYSNEEQIQVKPMNLYNKPAQSPTIVSIEYEEPTNINQLLEAAAQPRESDSCNLSAVYPSHIQTMKPRKVVNILSEKRISEPVVVGGKLEHISPSMIIKPARKFKSNLKFEQSMNPPLKNEKRCLNNNLQDNDHLGPKDVAVVFEQVIPIEYAPKDSETNPSIYQNDQVNMNLEKLSDPFQLINLNSIENQEKLNDALEKQIGEIPIEHVLLNSVLQRAGKEVVETETVSRSNENIIFTPTSTPAYKSVLRSKITPEKLAAIEEKRKFNLKLRDVITSCLDNLDEQNEVIDKKISQGKNPTAMKRRNDRTLLLKQPCPTSSEGTMIAFLEHRLQRMEDTLLNKIDLNTQRINDLKKTKKTSNSKNANTQTYLNHMSELSQKQYLYKEISKFLSPTSNIQIYEELFTDKISHDEQEIPTPRKLRKRR